jgi:hypothetical protein
MTGMTGARASGDPVAAEQVFDRLKACIWLISLLKPMIIQISRGGRDEAKHRNNNIFFFVFFDRLKQSRLGFRSR